MNTNQIKAILELIFGIVDRLISAGDLKTRIYNMVAMLVIFLMVFTAYQWEDLRSFVIEAKYDSFREALVLEREERFEIVVQQQVQILHINTKADLTLVYEYYPPQQYLFFNALFYDGKLPGELYDVSRIEELPIDKTSSEYKTHVSGNSFISSEEFSFFPSDLNDSFGFIFSCPIFNLDNVYSGNISMLWYENPEYNKEKLESIDFMCTQSARFLGRAK